MLKSLTKMVKHIKLILTTITPVNLRVIYIIWTDMSTKTHSSANQVNEITLQTQTLKGTKSEA